MEQRLRLVQGSGNTSINRHERRGTDRHRIEVPGQIVWKDAKGATRMVDVVTRDISETGVCVVCQAAAPIPLYRMCYFQVDRNARHRLDLPALLRKSSVLSAIFRVGPINGETGAPTEYGLRLLVEPASAAPAKAVWSDERKTRTA
jgi:hypothetical protein